MTEKKVILYTMKGCSPCKDALEDLKDLALERGSMSLEIRDATKEDAEKKGISSAPCTCVVADGKDPDLKLDCVLGHSRKYKEEIRERLNG
jgi:glutaredoxin